MKRFKKNEKANLSHIKKQPYHFRHKKLPDYLYSNILYCNYNIFQKKDLYISNVHLQRHTILLYDPACSIRT